MKSNTCSTIGYFLFVIVFLSQPLLGSAQNLDCTELTPWGIPFSEDAYDVEVVGTTAYVAAGSDGLVVYDISQPRKPQLLGRYQNADSYAQDIAVLGSYAYIANDDDGLLILDISDPLNPSQVGAFTTTENAFKVAVQGNYAYVSTDDYALQIININNPAVPFLAHTWMTEEYVQNVAFAGNYAYLANERDGLQILNISNPSAPVLVGTGTTDSYVYDVEVHGNYAYLANYDDGLQIVDISDPSAPVNLGAYETSSDTYELDVIGDYAYVSVYDEGLEIIDISDKNAPSLVAAPQLDCTGLGLAVSGTSAYLCTGNALLVVDVSNPATPVGEDQYDPESEPAYVAAQGHLIYVGTYNPSSLQIFDATDPDAVIYLGGCMLSGRVERITIKEDYAYIACGYDGLTIVDITDSTAPFEVVTVDTPSSYMRSIVVRLPYLYVGDNGLRIYDISDPANPEQLSYLGASHGSGSIAVSGDTAALISDSIVKLIDISNVRAPAYTGTYTPPQRPYALDLSASTLYVVCPNNGFVRVDISDPSAPSFIDIYNPAGVNFQGFDISGNIAYLSLSGEGLELLDISDPNNLVSVGSINPDAYFRDVICVDGNAIMRNSDYFISVIEVSSSNAPVITCMADEFEQSISSGFSPPNISFKVRNSGAGLLSYSIGADVPWITPMTVAGSSSGEYDSIELSFNAAAMEGGFHIGTVTVTDPAAVNSPFTIPVELWIEPTPIEVSPTSLPSGMEMVPYNATLGAINGTPPYTWKVVDGWPEGITNIADGTVSGRVILAGSYQVDVEVTDARGRRINRPVNLEIELNPNRPPEVASTAPATGDIVLPESINQPIIVTASDPESGLLSYSWTLDGVAVGGDSNQFNFVTIWGDAGAYELEVLVSDGLWDTVILNWAIEVTDDNDGDGIPNDFENNHPLLSAWNAADGAADNDSDYLDNLGEYLAGTLLDNPDCDSDGLPDGWEVRYGFDPLDDPGGLPGILCSQEGSWTGGWVGTLTALGDYLYTGASEPDSNWGLRIFNISTPANPSIIGRSNISTYNTYREVVINGNYAYIAEDNTGIHVFNISNPSAPSRVRVIAGEPYGLLMEGSYLYEVDQYDGLKIYSLSNPSAPALVSTTPASYPWDVVKQGNYAYLACLENGLKVLDVSDPVVPFVAATLAVSDWRGRSFATALKDDYAYIADGEAGLQVVDISSPTNPVLVATCNTPGSAFDIDIEGNYVYIASYDQSLVNDQMQVIDISDPTSPRRVGGYIAGREAYTLQCSGNMVYVGAGNGLHVVRCTSEDTDEDGLADAWEMEQWSSLARDGSGDFDNDGITDLGEFRSGLNPKVDDQDEDGIRDGDEVSIYNADPRKSDSDNDGISDADEIMCGTSLSDDGDVLECSDLVPVEGDTGITITWASVSGHSYRIESCSDLTEGSWAIVVPLVTATGTSCSAVDTSLTVPDGRYYRVVALP